PRVDWVQGAAATVVQVEQRVLSGSREVASGDEPWSIGNPRERVEIAGESRHRVFERPCARPLEARGEGVVGDVVIAQAGDLEADRHGAPRAATARGGRRSATTACAPSRAPRTER